MTKDEALKMALEALKELTDTEQTYGALERGDTAITTIKAALAQPEPDPTPEQLAALGWQSIECPFCGTSGAQAFPKPKEQQSCDKRELESTTDMMMALADRLGELPDDIDPRAWEHLLVYAPKPCPTCEALARTVMLDQTSHDRHKREWVGLTEKKVELVYEDVSGQSLRTQDYRLVLQFAVAIEAKLKELNA